MTRLAGLFLLVAGVHAKGKWEETPCDAIGVTKNNINLRCNTFCKRQATMIFDGMEATDDGSGIFHQILKCQCSEAGDSEGCLDKRVILDPKRPVPSCDSLGIGSGAECKTICAGLGMQGGFSDVNGKSHCTCLDADTNAETGADICDDDPSCDQLMIFPGRAAEGCDALCDGGGPPVATDIIDFAGPNKVGTKAQTHLKVGCRCGGVERCHSSILFSDQAYLDGCRDELEITSSETCSQYCQRYGFVGDSSYGTERKLKNRVGKCSCSDAEGTTALACDDAAVEADASGTSARGGFLPSLFGVTLVFAAVATKFQW